MQQLSRCIYKTPIAVIGKIQIIADGEQLCMLDFADNEARVERLLKRRYGAFSTLKSIPLKADVLDMQSRLARYFDGDWTAFDGLKPDQAATAGTDFQRQVWAQLNTIPVGTTLSYSEVATAINRPRAAQAVGCANSNNPLVIIVPCHRVIGENGELRGFTGGIVRQEALLKHEGLRLG